MSHLFTPIEQDNIKCSNVCFTIFRFQPLNNIIDKHTCAEGVVEARCLSRMCLVLKHLSSR